MNFFKAALLMVIIGLLGIIILQLDAGQKQPINVAITHECYDNEPSYWLGREVKNGNTKQ